MYLASRFYLPAITLLAVGLLAPVPASAQTPATDQPSQTVRGRVVDQALQTPLPGANVVVLGTEPLLGTTTDGDGRFVLPHVPLGRHTFRITFIGYEPAVRSEVLVTAGKEVVLQVALQEQPLEGDEVVVTAGDQHGQPLNDMAYVSARSFSVETTRRYAGGVDDPARLATAFAGVASAGGVQDNALVIRGNAPKGVQWYLEGVPIPNPNHFAGLSVAGGGGLTLFSSQLLADADFLTSAFPAEYGDALAGVFDMRFRTGHPTEREHAFQLGLLGIDVASEGPFIKGRPLTYLFNYRYATLGLLLPLLPTEARTTYQDLAFKLSFPTRHAGRFDVWGLGGLDGQHLPPDRDSTAWEYAFWDRTEFDLNLGIGAAGLSHHLVLSSRSYLQSTFAATVNRTRWDQERLDDDLVLQPNQRVHYTTGRLLASTVLSHKFSARHVLRSGVTVQQLFYDLDLQAAPDDVPPMVPVAQGDGTSTLVQLYAQSRLVPRPRWSLALGAHAQYFALTDRYSLEPRLGLQWQFANRQALSLGYGLHSQIEDLRFYFIQPLGSDETHPNRSLGFTRAHHAVLGYERRLGTSSRLKLEGYYQYLFDVPVVPDSSYALLNFEQDWTFDEPLVNAGAGHNYGLDLTLERTLQDGYYYLLTGSLFRSRYRGGDGRWRNTRFDQRYAANLLAGKEFVLGSRNNLLGLNGRLILVGGRWRSPVDTAASLEQKDVVFDGTRAFSVHEPGTWLLDLTITYRINRQRRTEIWALQVKNVLAAKDVHLDYNLATDRVEQVEEGFPLPVLSYKVEF